MMRPELSDRTADAVVFTWEGAALAAAVGPGASGYGPLRRRVAALCAAGVDVVIVSEAAAGRVGGQLGSQPDAPGRLLLSSDHGRELVLVRPDGPRALRRRRRSADLAGSMREILAVLGRRGIGPGLILVSGDFGPAGAVERSDRLLLVAEAARATVVSVGPDAGGIPAGVLHAGGGRQGLLRLMDEQLRRRARGRVPAIDDDPEWIISQSGADPAREQVIASLLTLGSRGLGTRGVVEEALPAECFAVLAAGVYRGGGSAQCLLPGPVWTSLHVAPPPVSNVRVLDLRTGVVARNEHHGPGRPLRSLRLVSIAAPGIVAMRAEAGKGRLRRRGGPLQPPLSAAVTTSRNDGRFWATTDADHGGGGIGVLAVQRSGRDADLGTVQRIAACVASGRTRPSADAAARVLRAAEDAGFDRLLAQHRAAWAARWETVDARIPDDPAVQLAVRYAVFQLWNNASAHGELAVGARGLSGPGYSGHVFWDTDVFVLPAMASIYPPAAAAMIRYRLRRLEAARALARACHREGARFPWESAATGEDVTPASHLLGGREFPVRTGLLEEHITADVAWAAVRFAEWSGRPRLAGPQLTMLLETARYWASRCRSDGSGAAHIDTVTGPDEYHEGVDDNAYTNVMARWNLRAAAAAADSAGVAAGDTARWRDLADRLVDGYDPVTGRYEQFAGYSGLKPLIVADLASPPVEADLRLGPELVAASQLIKQPDVLMLHHLVPGEVAAGSLVPNLDFYLPRTTHGSSLSPGVSASLLARAGRPDEALQLLRMALAWDLEDLIGTTSAGVHMANLGGIWQAMLGGFAGVRVEKGVLSVDPRLPASWGGLKVRFRCLGRRVRLSITRDQVEIRTSGPLLAGLAGQPPRRVASRASLGRPGD